jgi:hypothetical protein
MTSSSPSPAETEALEVIPLEPVVPSLAPERSMRFAPGPPWTTIRTTSAQLRGPTVGARPLTVVWSPAQPTTISSPPSLSTRNVRPAGSYVVETAARAAAGRAAMAATASTKTANRTYGSSPTGVKSPYGLGDRPKQHAPVERQLAKKLARALAQLGGERPAYVVAARALAGRATALGLPFERAQLPAAETFDRDGFHGSFVGVRTQSGLPEMRDTFDDHPRRASPVWRRRAARPSPEA